MQIALDYGRTGQQFQALHCLIAVALFVALGCQRTAPVSTVTSTTVVTAEDKKAAALKCLNVYFSEPGFELPIFIETSPYLPDNLDKVGIHPCEIISKEELAKRYSGKDYGPLLTSVHVYSSEKARLTQLRVRVASSGISIPGAKGIARGGGNAWECRIEGKDVVLVSTTGWKE